MAGFEAITSTRVARLYRMHPKLYGVVAILIHNDKHDEHGHVLVQAQLQLILSNQQELS